MHASQVVAELYGSDRERLVTMAYLLTRDRQAAEDVVQDVFLGLHRRWTGTGPPDDARRYLTTAVVNRCRSHARRRRAFPWLTHAITAGPSDPQNEAVVRDEHAAALRAVWALPTRQREVIVLRYWEDMTEAQIAAALGISPGTVKSSASRAMSKLHAALGEPA